MASPLTILPIPIRIIYTECIVYTWDYHSSASIWTGLKVQPILADEVQTFKALISVHKILQEGHPIVCIRSLYVQSTSHALYYRLSRKHKPRSAGLRRVRGQSATMAQEVRLLCTRSFSVLYKPEKDMPSSSAPMWPSSLQSSASTASDQSSTVYLSTKSILV